MGEELGDQTASLRAQCRDRDRWHQRWRGALPRRVELTLPGETRAVRAGGSL